MTLRRSAYVTSHENGRALYHSPTLNFIMPLAFIGPPVSFTATASPASPKASRIDFTYSFHTRMLAIINSGHVPRYRLRQFSILRGRWHEAISRFDFADSESD